MTPTTPGADPVDPPGHDSGTGPLPGPFPGSSSGSGTGSASASDGVSETDWHPSVEELSDFGEGLLPPGAGELVRSHLDVCPECVDTLDALTEIRALLGSTDSPQMPADVAERIDAALAAEALLAATAPPQSVQSEAAAAATTRGATAEGGEAEGGEAGSGAAGGGQAGTARTRTRRSERSHPAAGKGASTAPPSGSADHRPDSSTAATRGPGRAARRRRLSRALLGAAAAVIAAGLGTMIVRLPTADKGNDASAVHADSGAGLNHGPGLKSFTAGQGQQFPTGKNSGTAYTERNLDEQVRQLVGENAAPTAGGVPRAASPSAVPTTIPSPSLSGAAPPSLPQLAPGARPESAAGAAPVPACVRAAVHRTGDLPLAVDRGTFHSDPVVVLVYPGPRTSDALDVFIVDADCGGGTPPAPAEVRLHRTVPIS
jgi:hypothetical protein